MVEAVAVIAVLLALPGCGDSGANGDASTPPNAGVTKERGDATKDDRRSGTSDSTSANSENVSVAPPRDAAAPRAKLEIGRVGGGDAATRLRASAGCDVADPTLELARLRWTVAERAGTAQRVAVTTLRKGFQQGRFEVSRRLSSTRHRYVWRDLQAGLNYYWRVLTLHRGRVVSSRTETFVGPTCVADTVGPPG